MRPSLLDLMQPPAGAASEREGRFLGVVVGIVTNNEDPEKLGRVKLRFPWLSDEDESFWARVATPMSGPERGFFFLPEVEDEVLVAFEHGDLRFPFVVGCLWNGQDKPPESEPLDGDGKVAKRVIKSRAGHVVRFDDTEGEEKIEIIDKTESNSIVFDAASGTITIRAEGDVVIESTDGNVVLRGKGIEVESTDSDVSVKATGSMSLESDSDLTIKGSTVNIN